MQEQCDFVRLRLDRHKDFLTDGFKLVCVLSSSEKKCVGYKNCSVYKAKNSLLDEIKKLGEVTAEDEVEIAALEAELGKGEVIFVDWWKRLMKIIVRVSLVRPVVVTAINKIREMINESSKDNLYD